MKQNPIKHVINENLMSIEMCFHGSIAVVVHAHTNKFEVVVGIVVSVRKSNQYSIHLMHSQVKKNLICILIFQFNSRSDVVSTTNSLSLSYTHPLPLIHFTLSHGKWKMLCRRVCVSVYGTAN